MDDSATPVKDGSLSATSGAEDSVPSASRSLTLGQLAAALAKAQAKMEPPKKDKTAQIASTKGHYSYHYSDLASLVDAIRKPLSDNGLAFVQPLSQENGHMVLRTVLLHESGEWISSEYPIAMYDRPQEQGSALTYARRYSLGALVGLAPEDDDGAAAQKAQPRPAPPKVEGPVSRIDEQIYALGEALANVGGGNALELISRASAFYGKGHANEGDDMSARERWLEDVPFGAKVMTIQDLSKCKSEKWKTRTRLQLKERLKVLEESVDDPEAREGNLFNAPDPD